MDRSPRNAVRRTQRWSRISDFSHSQNWNTREKQASCSKSVQTLNPSIKARVEQQQNRAVVDFTVGPPCPTNLGAAVTAAGQMFGFAITGSVTGSGKRLCAAREQLPNLPTPTRSPPPGPTLTWLVMVWFFCLQWLLQCVRAAEPETIQILSMSCEKGPRVTDEHRGQTRCCCLALAGRRP